MKHYLDKYIFATELNGRKIIKDGYFLDLNNSDIDFLKKCISSEFYNQCDYSSSYFQPPIFITNVDSAVLFGNCGGVMIKDRLLVESFFSQKKMFKSKAYRSIENFKEESKNEGSYTSIFHQYSLNNNIFHWYIECLPRLHLLAYIQKPITILCPSNLLAYQLRQIETLSSKYSNVKIELINEDTVYKIKNYVFLSFLNNIRSGYLPKFALDYYTELVPKSNNLTTKKRLFIDRHLNKARNIVNKNEVEELLKKYNFEIVCLEELEPEEQMSFFKNLEIVVAVHGAGLTNLIFSEKVSVIELHPDTKINPPYFFLCKAKKIRYSPIICKAIDGFNNIIVDVKILEQELKKVI